MILSSSVELILQLLIQIQNYKSIHTMLAWVITTKNVWKKEE